MWFQLQNDRKILVVCRLFVTLKFNPIRFDFFLVWWVTLGKHHDASKKYFLSFQNPIIKCRTLFAWVMFPNDILCWKEKIMIEKLPGRRHCLYCLKQRSKAPEMAESHGQRTAARFLSTWEMAMLIVSDFRLCCCLLSAETRDVALHDMNKHLKHLRYTLGQVLVCLSLRQSDFKSSRQK